MKPIHGESFWKWTLTTDTQRSAQKGLENTMLRAAIAFFVLALIAMVLGASGFAGMSMEVGRTLLFVFLVLAVISFVANLLTGKRGGTPLP